MEAVAKKFDMAAVLSLMDLSVEAEAFGSPVRYSAEEVPTVTAPIIHDEDEAEALRVPEVGEGRTGECLKGIREIAGRVKDRPILAGMIGPYSLAGRLLDMTEIMILCYEDPGSWWRLCSRRRHSSCAPMRRRSRRRAQMGSSSPSRRQDCSGRDFSEISLCLT